MNLDAFLARLTAQRQGRRNGLCVPWVLVVIFITEAYFILPVQAPLEHWSQPPQGAPSAGHQSTAARRQPQITTQTILHFPPIVGRCTYVRYSIVYIVHEYMHIIPTPTRTHASTQTNTIYSLILMPKKAKILFCNLLRPFFWPVSGGN